jgi:hypothetical protein
MTVSPPALGTLLVAAPVCLKNTGACIPGQDGSRLMISAFEADEAGTGTMPADITAL